VVDVFVDQRPTGMFGVTLERAYCGRRGIDAKDPRRTFHQVKEPRCSELLDLLDPDTRVNIRRLCVCTLGPALFWIKVFEIR
jgi:hypothetical protein